MLMLAMAVETLLTQRGSGLDEIAESQREEAIGSSESLSGAASRWNGLASNLSLHLEANSDVPQCFRDSFCNGPQIRKL